MGWAAAIPIASAVLGGIGGKKKAKASKEPTRTFTNPSAQLGGWEKLREIMQGMSQAPQYRVGQGNPYLSGGMAHLMGRAGIASPEGGYGPNPYLAPPPSQIAEAAAPAPTPTPTPKPPAQKPGLIGAKKKRDELMKEIG